MTRLITRLYDSFFDAQHAVIELERAGVPHGDISVVSNRTDTHHATGVHVRAPREHTAGEAAAADAGVGAAAGAFVGGAGGVLAGLGLLAIPGLGPVVAAGWLATAAIGAVVGAAVAGAAGGIIGAMTNAGVSEAEAHVYAEGVRRGGTLVTARVPNDLYLAAEGALNRLPAVDVGQRGALYRERGWDRFDPNAPAYTDEEIAAERARYGAAYRDPRDVDPNYPRA